MAMMKPKLKIKMNKNIAKKMLAEKLPAGSYTKRYTDAKTSSKLVEAAARKLGINPMKMK